MLLLLLSGNHQSLTSYTFFTDDPEYKRAFAALEELDLCSLKTVFKEKRFRVLNFS